MSEAESTASVAPTRPATFLLGARVVGGIIRRGYDDMHLIVEDASGNQHRVVAHLADSDWRGAPWLLPADEGGQAFRDDLAPMVRMYDDLRRRIDQAVAYIDDLSDGWMPADAQPFFDEVRRILHTPGPGLAFSRVEWACAYADTEGFGEPRAVERDTAEGWVAFANAHNNPASLVRRTVIYSTWEPA